MYRAKTALSLILGMCLGELVMVWGWGLWESVASDPENSSLSTEGAVISPNATVDFVYNILELPCVPLMEHWLISLLLNLYTSSKTEPVDLH